MGAPKPTAPSRNAREERLAGLLQSLSRVEAQRRLLARESDALVHQAWTSGAIQADLARCLEVSQAAVSRLLSRTAPPTDPAGQREWAVADAVDAYEATRLSQADLAEALIAAGEGPMPAVDRAINRGTLDPAIVEEVRQAWARDFTEQERLERLDPDVLAEQMRAAVRDVVAALRDRGQDPARGEDLARRARATRAGAPADRAALILQCRAILAEGVAVEA